MAIKSSQTLVSEALKEVKTITTEEALKLSNEGKCNIIDIREKSESIVVKEAENLGLKILWSHAVVDGSKRLCSHRDCSVS